MHALFVVWAVVILVQLARPLSGAWAGAMVQLGTGWAAPSAAGVLAAATAHASVLLAAGGIAGVLWLAGLAVLPWSRSPRGLSAFAAFPAGYAGVSLGYLGLALTGLWFPRVLLPVLVLPGLVAVLVRGRRLLPRGTAWPAADGPGVLALAVLTCVVPWALAPETHPDGWEYFLAGPARWLAAHRFSVRGGTPPLHYPDIAEMLYVLPVWLGLDAVAKWLNALAMLCGALSVASLLPRESRSMGLLLFVTAATPLFLMTTGKNEGFAAGFVLLAVACAWRNAWTAGGFFAGLALSTKYLSVLNLAWLPLLMTPGRRRAQFTRWAALAAGTTAAWWVKAWLLTGDPAYPVASGFLPGLVDGWDARNARVWHLCTAVDRPAGSWPVRAVQGLTLENAALALCLPALLWEKGRARLAVAGSVAVYAAWQIGFPGPQTVRWAFPGVAAALVLSGGPARRWLAGPKYLRTALLAVCVAGGVHAFLRLAGNGMNPLPYLAGAESRAGYLARAFTTLVPASDAVRRGFSGGALLLVGEVREYGLPFPCRLASAHASGEAPLLWRLVHASATERDLEVRFRQLGIRRALYNYVTVKNVQFCHAPFRWDDRMLRLYAGFVLRHFKPLRVSDVADFSNGGFIVYGVTARAIPNPPKTAPYLPGAEAYCHTAVPLRNAGRMPEALRAYEALAGLCPEVLSFQAEWGHTLEMAGDWPGSFRLLGAAVRAGFAEPFHLVNFGLAALQMDRYAEADAVLTRCLAGAPSHAGAVRVSLGWARYGLALEAGKKRNLAVAEVRLAEAEGLLGLPAGPPGDRIENERRRRLAYVRGLQGDLARARREFPRAVERYRAAAALVPGTNEGNVWSELASRLANRGITGP
ncbi:MAG: tetratricopeptide repeat protein [Candidatus Coatesbacteria bacterium]